MLCSHTKTRKRTGFKEVCLLKPAFLSDSTPFPALSNTVGSKKKKTSLLQSYVIPVPSSILWLQTALWDFKAPLIWDYTGIMRLFFGAELDTHQVSIKSGLTLRMFHI